MPTTTLTSGSMPRSALRYRPIDADMVPEFVVLGTSVRASQTTQPTAHRSTTHKQTLHPLTLLGLSMVTTLLLLWGLQGLWAWGQMQLDTLHYGYPRTTQVDHAVGRTLTHFIATNLKGQIYLVEIASDTPGASRLLVGPHLLGPGVDLAPITLRFEGADVVVVEAAGVMTRFRAGAP